MLGDYDMKKGVSEVIAIILILMIVIALAALAYTWFSGIFASLTGTASVAVTTTTSQMATAFKIDTIKWTPQVGLAFTLRNVGSQSFNASWQTLGIYIDNNLVTASTWNFFSGPGCSFSSASGFMLEKGCTVTWSNNTFLFSPAGGAQVYCLGGCPGGACNISKITTQAGIDSKTIIC